jgi:hypothetical protein
MVRTSLSRLALFLLLACALPFAAGCGSNPFDPNDGGQEDPLGDVPQNDTPANTLARFNGTYTRQVIGEYEKLFTTDFRFTFSSESDPTLVSLYGNSWGKDDEVESTRHLFLGFTDDSLVFQAPAVQITMDIPFTQELDDPDHPDSTEHYRLLKVPRLILNLKLSDNQEFVVDQPQDFYLVRGDAALLDGSQSAVANRWYIRRWDDLSRPIARPGPIQTASTTPVTLFDTGSTSWGLPKDLYRR